MTDPIRETCAVLGVLKDNTVPVNSFIRKEGKQRSKPRLIPRWLLCRGRENEDKEGEAKLCIRDYFLFNVSYHC